MLQATCDKLTAICPVALLRKEGVTNCSPPFDTKILERQASYSEDLITHMTISLTLAYDKVPLGCLRYGGRIA